MNAKPIAELMTQRAEQVSAEIQGLLHGLGVRTQGAILADLVSLWLAGQFEASELDRPLGSDRPLTAELRSEALLEFVELVTALVPESEKQLMRKVEPKGRA
jgi:hypothetical protein